MPSVLVINDGSLSALVACAAERDRGADVIVWIPPAPSGLSEPGFTPPGAPPLIHHQAGVLGYQKVIQFPAPHDTFPAPHSGIDTSILLLEAARAASANGCSRVLWPLALGDDLRGMSWADERTELVNRLLLVDQESGTGKGVEIVLPLIDLSPSQIEDLASDLGVPRHLYVSAGVVERSAA